MVSVLSHALILSNTCRVEERDGPPTSDLSMGYWSLVRTVIGWFVWFPLQHAVIVLEPNSYLTLSERTPSQATHSLQMRSHRKFIIHYFTPEVLASNAC